MAIREEFQRLFMMSEPEALSLNAQAALGQVQPERSQFSLLVRHFLERFFNHETASPDGDAEARLVLIAFTVGLPEFVVALYLWPVYHPFPGWPPGRGPHVGPPPYWLQVNHHLFFVLYSFVAMGIATLFEWDLFFPDLLDIFVLTTLPVVNRRLFLARVAAIAILVAGFLFDANLLAPLVLPSAIDPPNIARFLAGHLLAVTGGGLYAALFILALQGVLLSVLGERLFRKLSLLIQGLSISVSVDAPPVVPSALRCGSRVASVRQRLSAPVSSVLVSGHLPAPHGRPVRIACIYQARGNRMRRPIDDGRFGRARISDCLHAKGAPTSGRPRYAHQAKMGFVAAA